MNNRQKSAIKITSSSLNAQELLAAHNLLLEHVRDGNGVPQNSEIAQILDCMQGLPDELGRQRTYFLAKDSDTGALLGCIAYSPAADDLAQHCGVAAVAAVEVHNVFVFQHAQKRGVGTALFTRVCDAARNQGKQWALVMSGPRYEASWKFYNALCDTAAIDILNAYGQHVHAKTWIKSLHSVH